MTTAMATLSAPVLVAQGLIFCWPGAAPLWNGLNLGIPAGVSLLRGGESSGKSTLLRLLCGDLLPSAGTLSLGAVSLGADPGAYRRHAFRTDPHSAALDAISAVEWFQRLGNERASFQPSALPGLINGFALEPHLHKPLYMLSTGSRRKVWLTGALAAGTALTLLDEPFAALDMPSIRFLHHTLQQLAQHPQHAHRAWLLADYEVPAEITLASVIELPNMP